MIDALVVVLSVALALACGDTASHFVKWTLLLVSAIHTVSKQMIDSLRR